MLHHGGHVWLPTVFHPTQMTPSLIGVVHTVPLKLLDSSKAFDKVYNCAKYAHMVRDYNLCSIKCTYMYIVYYTCSVMC